MAVGPPLIWRNREQVNEVDRARGVAVTWKSSRTGAVVLIVAMNADARTGALGVCACVANAGSGRFQIPPYALANIPPTPAHPRGFPLNLMILAELPDTAAAAAQAAWIGWSRSRLRSPLALCGSSKTPVAKTTSATQPPAPLLFHSYGQVTLAGHSRDGQYHRLIAARDIGGDLQVQLEFAFHEARHGSGVSDGGRRHGNSADGDRD